MVSIQIDQAESKQIQIQVFFNFFNEQNTFIRSDMRRLQQVLLNLLSNAIKFTNRHGNIIIQSRMIHSFDGEKENHFVEIQVTDNGVGMNKKEKENLFKLFGTMKNTRESNTQGVGLGLCISRMIVESFDGTVQVES